VGPTGQNAEEIEALYRQHGAALLLFARSISGDRARAEDVVHQVFLKLIKTGELARANDKKAYLFACVRNAALNDSKMQRRSTALEADTMWFTPPERDYAAEATLRRALGVLPEEQREVIVLHLWGGFTFAEIAGLLDISSNTAASRYRYGLAKLRDAMFTKEDSCANFR
jgi:RNA polymerase sigma-70 factor (ECF subfamily)